MQIMSHAVDCVLRAISLFFLLSFSLVRLQQVSEIQVDPLGILWLVVFQTSSQNDNKNKSKYVAFYFFLGLGVCREP